jgi:REP element-mobilizing transposase RayT
MTNPVPLEHGQYYHIYNRGNNRENLFVEERNYPYFLKLYAQHIEPVANTFAYCLLPNHFHFLVQIKDEQDLTGFENLSGLKMSGLKMSGLKMSGLKRPSQYFSNLFNAYARAFNKAYDRTGSLFQRPFGRVPVTSEAYLVWLVTYIHQNPEKHGIVPEFRHWPHSSYHAHLSREPTRLQRDDVLAWFDGKTGFMPSHEQRITEHQITLLAPDDFD